MTKLQIQDLILSKLSGWALYAIRPADQFTIGALKSEKLDFPFLDKNGFPFLGETSAIHRNLENWCSQCYWILKFLGSILDFWDVDMLFRKTAFLVRLL